MKPIRSTFQFLLGALGCLLIFIGDANASTTLLPTGKQCFTDANGPIVSGSLNIFYPSTTTPKPNWQDSGQVTQNSNPIQLDANGCALIYGVGSYRQQLYDGPVVSGNVSGNLVYDALTTDTSAYNSVYWAGLSGGTPNVITITDAGFNSTDGAVINFTALATNTGSSTLNPGSGAILIEKDTTAGPASLAGGEIVQNNAISVIYRAFDNAFHLLNPPIQSASGTTAPRCGMSNLKITNDGTTPNSIVDITAGQTVMVSSGGLNITRGSISTTINTSLGNATTALGGMDGEAPGTSAWIYIFLIDNGASSGAVASLAAGNGLAPVLPSGYIYVCYAGAIRVYSDGTLLRTIQLTNRVQYIIGTNPSLAPNIANGSAGTYSATSPTLTTASITSVVPPTASEITIIATTSQNGNSSPMLLAPNVNWGGTNRGPTGNANNGWPLFLNNSGANSSSTLTMVLEGSTVAWAANGTGAAISAAGWKDGYVNAP